MAWCLLPEAVERFKKGLRDGKINPDRLNGMTTAERVGFLSDYVGEQAVELNRRFEKSVLLKRRDAAMLKWAREASGIPGARREAMVARVKERAAQRESRIFDPKEEETFLASLAEQRTGSSITREEAKGIFELSKRTNEALSKYDANTGKWASREDRIAYGSSWVALHDYVDGLKDPRRGMGIIDSTKSFLRETGQRVRERPVFGPVGIAVDAINGLSNLSVSMVASLDNSFIGRQGLGVLQTNPSAWFPAAVESFSNFAKTVATGEDVMAALRADIVSRPNAINGNYKTAGILDLNEEQHPSSLPERIPFLGRFYRGSETAFKGSAMRMRADLFDLLLDAKESVGTQITKDEVKSTGRIVGSLTGRGDLGRSSGVLEAALWAAKMLKANVDVLTFHTADYATGKITLADYRRAFTNLLKMIAVTTVVLKIAQAVNPNSVEENATSADFGKVKIGTTRLDVTGGKGSIITLVARYVTGEKKSTTTDQITKLEPGFGKSTRFDVLVDFLVNKFKPSVRVLVDFARGRDPEGNAPTIESEFYRSFVSIGVQNLVNAMQNPSLGATIALPLDFVGISGNTYAESNIKSGIIPEGQKISNNDFIQQVVTYAKAIGTDPETAFNRIFTGQKIRRVDNGAIIVERMSLEESTAVKEAGGGNNPTMKLDHTIPLELGGSNAESNLKLVTTSQWQSYTKVENHLGDLLRDGKISKQEAQDLIVRFKEGRIKAEEILAK